MINQGTIIAKASGAGSSAISLFRLSGSNSIEMVSDCFQPKSQKKLLDQKSHTVHLGTLKHNGDALDEVLVSIFKAPHSYTGENIVEISCHGSNYIQEEILRLFISKGAQPAKPGEFTLRAFLNKKMDLSQAEAVADLIVSESKAAHEVAMNQMRGGYTAEIAQLRQKLLDFASLITLELDFAEEDVAFADRTALTELLLAMQSKIKSLLDSFQYGSVIKKGVPVAIVGKPNAGKSSLLNALLNEDRAIVSAIPGTTRDTIEDTLTISGVEFRFIDTAGLRETDDQIEAVGVAKAKEKVNLAKVMIYLFDANDTSLEEINTALNEFKREGLIILLVENKIDLIEEQGKSSLMNALKRESDHFPNLALSSISTFDRDTIEQLKKTLYNQIEKIAIQGDIVVSNARHYEALQNALQAILNIKKGLKDELSGDLLSVDINEALNYLGEISGEITNDELLGNIFSKFCIGK
ncbi:tRNA uridine-5-carboxymethylaminomethyl(34) synthesis GTPase MnmE [Flavobacteriaceae bacterium]|nr:tRNA uridine-5-carboxymethylaminomethyl(34) synthesis GTPase MnmE [Flavobacteriaceae bacterium]MDB2314671.1 tRNA uridine-5-carboxymethylaminomethyl(34) synthesis GTPase MnmE [Flavobacteriaceae bacterium]